jgi:hypothetical protein
MSCDIVREGQQALRPTTDHLRHDGVLVDLQPNAQLGRAKVVEQEKPRNAFVDETQQENRKMLRSLPLSFEAPPESGQYVASNYSFNAGTSPLSKQAVVTKTSHISVNGLPETDDIDDGTDSDNGIDDEIDVLLPTEDIAKHLPTSGASSSESPPADAPRVACAVTTRSLNHSPDGEPGQASKTQTADFAVIYPPSESNQQILIPVVDPRDSSDIDHMFNGSEAEDIKDPSPVFDKPKKVRKTCIPTSDAGKESAEPPSKRHRTRNSHQSTRESASDVYICPDTSDEVDESEEAEKSEVPPVTRRPTRRSPRLTRKSARDGSICLRTSDERAESGEPPVTRPATRSSPRLTRKSAKDGSTCLPTFDETEGSKEAPTTRRRAGKSLRSSRQSVSDNSLPQNIELLLSSHVRLDDETRDFFDRQGVLIHQDFKRCRSNLVHIVPEKGPFRTVKVLRTLIASGVVVKRSWVRDTIRKSQMQPLEAHVPSVLKTGIELIRTSVFAGKTLIFTPTAQEKIKRWKEVCALAMEAGCAKIHVGSKSQIMSCPFESTICLFGDNSVDDGDAADWMRDGRVVWDWHLLARSILAGRLDLEDDHYKLSLPLGSCLIDYDY